MAWGPIVLEYDGPGVHATYGKRHFTHRHSFLVEDCCRGLVVVYDIGRYIIRDPGLRELM